MRYVLTLLVLLAQLSSLSKPLLAALNHGAQRSEPRTVACVGDSITYGEMPYSGGSRLLDYPTVLGELLGEGWTVYNFGRPAASLTPPGLVYLDCREHDSALDLGADVYLIMLGSNDSAKGYDFDGELFEQTLTDLVALYREANPQTKIYLLTPPFTKPHYGTMYYSLNPWLLSSDIHDIVARVAGRQGTGLLDIYSITMENPDWVGGDGVHFTQDGYRAMGEYIHSQIAEELTIPGS